MRTNFAQNTTLCNGVAKELYKVAVTMDLIGYINQSNFWRELLNLIVFYGIKRILNYDIKSRHL